MILYISVPKSLVSKPLRKS